MKIIDLLFRTFDLNIQLIVIDINRSGPDCIYRWFWSFEILKIDCGSFMGSLFSIDYNDRDFIFDLLYLFQVNFFRKKRLFFRK